MTKERVEFKSLLPPITAFSIKTMPTPIAYIAAAGFEDRAIAILDMFIRRNAHIESAIAIEYKPHGDSRNRIDEFREKLERVCTSIVWVSYNRRNPQNFQDKLSPLLQSLDSFHVLIDISAMSKFLIMVIMQILRKIPNDAVVAYAEAGVYHPTKEEFEKERKKSGTTPDFLTTGVYDILTVSSLSSVSMQGYPILLVVFPTFNHFEIVALYNELSPQHMVLLEGDPHKKVDKWRLDAIREVNKSFFDNPDYNVERRVQSTFDYASNVETLEGLYEKYCGSHKILLAPTGSKLQTIAAFMFKQLHPDVQIVYPVAETFIGEYSDGCRATWSIHLGEFSDFTASLNNFRLQRGTMDSLQ
jgi:hypothetical protein